MDISARLDNVNGRNAESSRRRPSYTDIAAGPRKYLVACHLRCNARIENIRAGGAAHGADPELSGPTISVRRAHVGRGTRLRKSRPIRALDS
jgi:hypothetical protein